MIYLQSAIDLGLSTVDYLASLRLTKGAKKGVWFTGAASFARCEKGQKGVTFTIKTSFAKCKFGFNAKMPKKGHIQIWPTRGLVTTIFENQSGHRFRPLKWDYKGGNQISSSPRCMHNARRVSSCSCHRSPSGLEMHVDSRYSKMRRKLLAEKRLDFHC